VSEAEVKVVVLNVAEEIDAYNLTYYEDLDAYLCEKFDVAEIVRYFEIASYDGTYYIMVVGTYKDSKTARAERMRVLRDEVTLRMQARK